MSDQADLLFQAIHRGALLQADALGLTLTADELRQVRERIVLAWFVEKLTDHEMLTVGEWWKRYE